MFRLPISEYPQVVPPTVVVRAIYPGANPRVIAETVASPLEHQITGVEDMLYMYSQATADGVMTLTVTFGIGTDLDNAQVQVQNRVAQALPRLPAEVQRIGVTTEKSSPDLMMVVHLVSPDSRYDILYLSNYAHLQVRDEIARIQGIGNAQVFGGGEYSMRVWLDPDRLASRRLTAGDVVVGDSRAEHAGCGGRARRAAGADGHDVPARRSMPAAGSRPKTSSRTSSSAPRPKGRSRAFATSGASSSGRTPTRCGACSTTSRPSASASSSGPDRTRSKRRTRCAR